MGTHPIFESDFDCLTEMGKLSITLTVALFGASQATANEPYATTSCNDAADNNAPALTYTITKDYFDLYYAEDVSLYTLTSTSDGTEVYERKISQNDLVPNWDDPDNLMLTYTISPSTDGYSIGGGEFIRFSEESIRFQCSYPRNIDTEEHDFTVQTDFQPQPIHNTGTLSYSLDVTEAVVGQEAEMRITAEH